MGTECAPKGREGRARPISGVKASAYSWPQSGAYSSSRGEMKAGEERFHRRMRTLKFLLQNFERSQKPGYLELKTLVNCSVCSWGIPKDSSKIKYEHLITRSIIKML